VQLWSRFCLSGSSHPVRGSFANGSNRLGPGSGLVPQLPCPGGDSRRQAVPTRFSTKVPVWCHIFSSRDRSSGSTGPNAGTGEPAPDARRSSCSREAGDERGDVAASRPGGADSSPAAGEDTQTGPSKRSGIDGAGAAQSGCERGGRGAGGWCCTETANPAVGRWSPETTMPESLHRSGGKRVPHLRQWVLCRVHRVGSKQADMYFL
jgi:hypothetical protein